MEIKPGISLATVSAVLHTKDNKHVLQVRGRVSWACTPELPLGPGKMRNPPDRPHQWSSHSSQHKAETRLLNGLDWKQNTRVRSSLLFPWPHASERETGRAAIIPRARAAHHPTCSSWLRKDRRPSELQRAPPLEPQCGVRGWEGAPPPERQGSPPPTRRPPLQDTRTWEPARPRAAAPCPRRVVPHVHCVYCFAVAVWVPGLLPAPDGAAT